MREPAQEGRCVFPGTRFAEVANDPWVVFPVGPFVHGGNIYTVMKIMGIHQELKVKRPFTTKGKKGMCIKIQAFSQWCHLVQFQSQTVGLQKI